MPKRIFYIEFTLKLQYLTLYGTQIGDRGEGGVVLELVNPGGRNTAAKRNAHEHKIWHPVSFLFPV